MTTMHAQPGEQSRDSGATATLTGAPNPAEVPARNSHIPLTRTVSESAGPPSKLTTDNYPVPGLAWAREAHVARALPVAEALGAGIT